jgi:hypothetical protein
VLGARLHGGLQWELTLDVDALAMKLGRLLAVIDPALAAPVVPVDVIKAVYLPPRVEVYPRRRPVIRAGNEPTRR